MKISDFYYDLPDERIAKFPVKQRDGSKLLVWRGEDCGDGGSGLGDISETVFSKIGSVLPPDSLLIFNNTKVIRARLMMENSTGARIEVMCLEPCEPADYERAFIARGACEWRAMVGNSKRWKSGSVECGGLRAYRGAGDVVRFEWNDDLTFGEMLERLGRVPIPPYLGRESEQTDNTRYQTVYSRIEGSVAAPTAGLHFTGELIEKMRVAAVEFDEVTLHVGAGTFLPVKTENALEHQMHTEHFEVRLATIERLVGRISDGGSGRIIAVGTTSVRTLESLVALGWRVERDGDIQTQLPVGQFELNKIPEEFDGRMALEKLAEYMRERGVDKIIAATQIMITPGYNFRIVKGLITNFHQPKSTLLLLVSAFVGDRGEGGIEEWRRIYDYAMEHDFRFLSYGDSSLLLP